MGYNLHKSSSQTLAPAGDATSAGGFVEVTYTTTVAVACPHDCWCLAAGFMPPEGGALLCQSCPPPPPPWHSYPLIAVACAHGFTVPPTYAHPFGPTHFPPLPRRCPHPACAVGAAQLTALSARALVLPARADPLRWRGELDMRAPGALRIMDAITATPFGATALHEHSGAFRDAWQRRGVRAASVADRPSTSPPPAPSVHFIADVREWHSAYRWSIPMATSNPDCHCATIAAPNAAPSRWLGHIRSGAMAMAVVHVAWTLHAADMVAMEQPPTLLEDIMGPPSQRTCVADFGCPRRKAWWWWLRGGLPTVPPTNPLPPDRQPSEHHLYDNLPGLTHELISLR